MYRSLFFCHFSCRYRPPPSRERSQHRSCWSRRKGVRGHFLYLLLIIDFANVVLFLKQNIITPLHSASYKGNAKIARLLLDNGANMENYLKIVSCNCNGMLGRRDCQSCALLLLSLPRFVTSLLCFHRICCNNATLYVQIDKTLENIPGIRIVVQLVSIFFSAAKWRRRRVCVWLSCELSGGDNILYHLPTDMARICGAYF